MQYKIISRSNFLLDNCNLDLCFDICSRSFSHHYRYVSCKYFQNQEFARWQTQSIKYIVQKNEQIYERKKSFPENSFRQVTRVWICIHHNHRPRTWLKSRSWQVDPTNKILVKLKQTRNRKSSLTSPSSKTLLSLLFLCVSLVYVQTVLNTWLSKACSITLRLCQNFMRTKQGILHTSFVYRFHGIVASRPPRKSLPAPKN